MVLLHLLNLLRKLILTILVLKIIFYLVIISF
nr:MAG TPA: hypothetical protein [Caudoviricetes sp.]